MVGDGSAEVDRVPDAEGEGDDVRVADGLGELVGDGCGVRSGSADEVPDGDEVAAAWSTPAPGSTIEGLGVWTGSTTELPAPDGDGDVDPAGSTDGWVMPMISRICCSYSSSRPATSSSGTSRMSAP